MISCCVRSIYKATDCLGVYSLTGKFIWQMSVCLYSPHSYINIHSVSLSLPERPTADCYRSNSPWSESDHIWEVWWTWTFTTCYYTESQQNIKIKPAKHKTWIFILKHPKPSYSKYVWISTTELLSIFQAGVFTPAEEIRSWFNFLMKTSQTSNNQMSSQLGQPLTPVSELLSRSKFLLSIWIHHQNRCSLSIFVCVLSLTTERLEKQDYWEFCFRLQDWVQLVSF